MNAIYIRVSTTGQNEAGQLSEIQKWLDGHGMEATVYVDRSTGDNLQRDGFKRLQSDIFAGKIKCVIVYKLDRLSRSLADGINTLTDWLQRGVRVVSITQQLDFSGAAGKLIASVLFAVAEMEQETRRERQAAGIAVAKKEGKYSGRKSGTTKEKPTRARRLREQGLTYKEIANAMSVSTQTVRRYLGVI
ncbi:recombinase family protein [Planctomycetes bacterium TBK1r]|uniref:DNA-invertase hin n=1 Tax=Stieleria magnilauensis TaxID=2527963 RepID=A0ABX5XUE5_9BACT|nr:DNA-invertase hin [Planctomycetes bacterium TBK1r]